MSESRRTTRGLPEITALDLGQHLTHVAGREGMAHCRPDDLQLLPGIAHRLGSTGGAERTPDPLRHRHLLCPGCPPDLPPLGFVQEHLESLAHEMSLLDHRMSQASQGRSARLALPGSARGWQLLWT